MVEVSFTIRTQLAPQDVLAGATDFSERRPDIWSAIDPSRYQVHALGANWAEVTEGGPELGGIWSREHYDWSMPGQVRAEVKESNVFRPGSSWKLLVSPTENGGSEVVWTTVRHPSGFKGRVLVTMLALAGRRHLASYLRRTLAQLEMPVTHQQAKT